MEGGSEGSSGSAGPAGIVSEDEERQGSEDEGDGDHGGEVWFFLKTERARILLVTAVNRDFQEIEPEGAPQAVEETEG